MSDSEHSDLLTPSDDPKDDAPCAPKIRFKRPLQRAGPVAPQRSDDDACASQSSRSQPKETAVNVAASAEKYRCLFAVGNGQYGRVYKAENTVTKEIVACKVAKCVDCPILNGFPLSIVRELGIMRKLQDCKSVVRLIEVVASKRGEPIIVMEYCQASLQELLQSKHHSSISMGEIKYIIRQMLDGLTHMHSFGILHRDLATKNILFNLSGEIKVCDFGISRFGFGQDFENEDLVLASDLEPPEKCVSLYYRSIELCLGESKYGPKLDTWSAGCVVAEILISINGRQQPFFGGSRESPNRTPQMLVHEIFQTLGCPTEASWPGCKKLKEWSTFVTAEKRLAWREHRQPMEEKDFLQKYFGGGDNKIASIQQRLTGSFFEFLASLLTLNPSDRATSRSAMDANWFKELPLPEWHGKYWSKFGEVVERERKMPPEEPIKKDQPKRVAPVLDRRKKRGKWEEPKPVRPPFPMTRVVNALGPAPTKAQINGGGAQPAPTTQICLKN